MIIDFLINIFTSVTGAIFNILPNASLPDGVNSALETFVPYLAQANAVFPINTIFVVISIILTIEIIILTFQGFVYLYKLLPGKFT